MEQVDKILCMRSNKSVCEASGLGRGEGEVGEFCWSVLKPDAMEHRLISEDIFSGVYGKLHNEHIPKKYPTAVSHTFLTLMLKLM